MLEPDSMFIVIVPSAPVWAFAFLKVATAIWQEPNCLGNQTLVLLVWATLHTPHCIVKPVELSRGLKRIQLLANASQLFHLSCNKRYCYRLEKCQLAELLRLLNRLSVWRQSRLRTQKFLGNCYFRTNLCPIGS